MNAGKAAAFAAGAVLAVMIEAASGYFIAPPQVPAILYCSVALFAAGFCIAIVIGYPWLAACGMFVGQILYHVSTTQLLPLHPILLAGLDDGDAVQPCRIPRRAARPGASAQAIASEPAPQIAPHLRRFDPLLASKPCNACKPSGYTLMPKPQMMPTAALLR